MNDTFVAFFHLQERSDSIPRIIVKTNYMKSKTHKEYYVNYIATRDGVEKIESSHGNKSATPKQKQLIENLLKDYPDTSCMFEYEDYVDKPTRKNASELITSVMDQNIYDIATKENYIDYIANRPRVERLGEHGLFTDAGVPFELSDIVKEVGAHEGNVWTHIISLKREDAKRLGYDNAHSWMELCRAKRNELADAMRINPNDLKWFASFHNEGHHPHIHMVVYSNDPKKGYVTTEGIARIRKMFSSEIFHHDLLHIYEGQTKVRDEIKKYSKEVIDKMLSELEGTSFFNNPNIITKLKELKESLKEYHGRMMYAYIPKESKEMIDNILLELSKEEHVSELYEQWKLYKQDIHETYSNKFMEHLPLFKQKEFKSIKNMILNEVMNDEATTAIYHEQLNEMEEEVKPLEIDEDTCESFDEGGMSTVTKGYKLEWSDHYKKAVELFYGSKSVPANHEESKKLLLEECEEGNVLSFELLAKLYEIQKDDQAFECYQKALEGSLDILDSDESPFIQSYLNYKVGKFYFYGKGCHQDYEEAYHHLKQSDNEYAKYTLGTMYQRGYYVQQSDEQAFDYYQQSASKGFPFASYEVGRFYEQGISVNKNLEEANKHYKRAYEKFKVMVDKQEDDHLLYRLGMMTYAGKGVEKDVEKAKDYLKKAVSFDNENAKYLLAKIYLEEYDYPHIPEAIHWLSSSTNPNASYLLGKEYYQGIRVEKDIKQAIQYLKKSAGNDNEYAMYLLGKIYLREPLYQDSMKATKYLYHASLKGNEYAQVVYGSELLKGEIVEKDVDTAIHYLSLSAKQNNRFAQYILGKLFLFGKDVVQDKEKAVEYLTLSTLQGNEYAKYLLEHLDQYQDQPLVLMTTRLFHHVSRIFTNTLPHTKDSPLYGVDKKLASKIKQKKIALGHHPKDHEITR